MFSLLMIKTSSGVFHWHTQTQVHPAPALPECMSQLSSLGLSFPTCQTELLDSTSETLLVLKLKAPSFVLEIAGNMVGGLGTAKVRAIYSKITSRTGPQARSGGGPYQTLSRPQGDA